MIIPKIIHQLWVGPDKRPFRWMNSWKVKHPKWKYMLWDNQAIEGFKFKNQKHINYYLKNKIWHGIADVARYEILNKFGGVWQGADSECLLPLDELFINSKYDAYCFYENEKLAPGLVAPLLACTPDNEFAKSLIQGLFEKDEVGIPWKTTGNLYMKEMIEKMNYPRLKIFPSYYFVPIYQGKRYEGKEKIYAEHHFGTTYKCYKKGR